MSRRLSLFLLQANLCTLGLLAAAFSHAGDTAPRATALAAKEVPTDSEFWELYDELADESGQLPAPEEIPPPKESLMPNDASRLNASKEDL